VSCVGCHAVWLNSFELRVHGAYDGLAERDACIGEVLPGQKEVYPQRSDFLVNEFAERGKKNVTMKYTAHAHEGAATRRLCVATAATQSILRPGGR
jgi:hypothetical protein